MRFRERLAIWLAWKMPRLLAYWCAIRVASHGTTGRFSAQVVPELTVMDALRRWDGKGIRERIGKISFGGFGL